MIEIRQYSSNSNEAIEYYKWVTDLWNKVDPYRDYKNGVKIPKPLLATIEDQLIGGLSFTAHKDPELDIEVVWVNTIFVHENNRRQGIASLLLDKVINVIDSSIQDRVYAYTDYPELYTKMGWYKLESTKDVVAMSLTGEKI